MRAIKFAALVPFLALTCAQAQTNIQCEINLFEQSSNGEPAVCGMEFTFAFRDDVYGGFGGATGSLSNAVINGEFVTLFKLIAMHNAERVKIVSAIVKAGESILRPVRSTCNNEMDFCGLYHSEDSLKIMRVEMDGVELRYSLQDNGLDLNLKLSPLLAKNFDSEAKEYNNCRRYILMKLIH